jgi:ribosome-binding factor A
MPIKPPTRRMQKINSVIQRAVSDIIMNRLGDPRIEGYVTISRVEITSDLGIAKVFLSIMAEDEAAKNGTFSAILHASSHIQSMLGPSLTMRYMPQLDFRLDEKMNKTLETLRIIEQASKEYKDKDQQESNDTEL